MPTKYKSNEEKFVRIKALKKELEPWHRYKTTFATLERTRLLAFA